MRWFIFLIVLVSFSILSIESINTAWATCGNTTPSSPNFVAGTPSFNKVDVTYYGPVSSGSGSLAGYYVTRQTSMQTGPNEQPFSSTPLSYWKFDGCVTGITDYGIAGVTLQSNVSPTYDPNGQIFGAVKLDGSTWFTGTSTRYNFQNNNAFSVSFWMKNNAPVGHNLINNNVAVISNVNGGYLESQGWDVWLQGNTDTDRGGYVNFDISDGTHEIRIRAWNSNLFDNTSFHHVVVTFDGINGVNGMSIYVDGALSSPGIIYSSTPGNIIYANTLTVGALSSQGSNAFTGWIDDLRIYNSQLLQPQVSDIFTLNAIASTGPLCVLTNTGICSGNPSDFPDTQAVNSGQTYQVCAVSQYGQGTCATTGNVSPNNNLPAAPTGLSASGTPVKLTWNAVNPPPTGYYITRKAGSDTTFGERPFSSRPMSYWKFDGPGTGLRDYGSLENDLQSSVNPSYDSSGKIGGAVKLDGTSTYFVAPNQFNYAFLTNQQFVISFWMKTNQLSNNNMAYNNVAVISKVNGAYTESQGWDVWLQSGGNGNPGGYVNFDISDGTNEIKTRVWNNNLLDTNWHQVIVTYNGNQSPTGLTIYIDGNPTTGVAGSTLTDDKFHDTITNTSPLTIGALSVSDTNKFTGELDEVRIYNSPLSSPAIQDLIVYNSITTGTTFTDDSNPIPSSPNYKVYAVNANGNGDASSTSTSQASVAFDQPNYLINHGAIITVNDPNANLKESVRDTVYVTVKDTSSNPNTSITIPLTETGPNTGVFDNTAGLLVLSSSGTSRVTPALGVNVGDTVSVNYASLPAQSAQVIANPGSYSTLGMPAESLTIISCGASPSSSGDAICDWWKNNHYNQGLGITVPTLDGLYYYHLPCGANTHDPVCPTLNLGWKDLYVQVDWMAGQTPDQSAINAVVNAFANRQVNLHVILDQQLPFYYDRINWNSAYQPGVPSFQDIKQQYFLTSYDKALCPNNLTPAQLTTCYQDIYNAKAQVFHYALFVHDLDASGQSGEGILYGNDFGVSLGDFNGGTGSPDDQAGTFMHELGHNLSLDHGGPTSAQDSSTNCKPNYLSVMSYLRQFSSFIYDRPVDYSDWAIGSWKTTQLNEQVPMPESLGLGIPHTAGSKTVIGGQFNPPTIIAFADGSAIDYDRDNNPNNTPTVNVHYFGLPGNACTDNSLRNLLGNDDWDNLQYSFTSSGNTVPRAGATNLLPPGDTEATYDEVQKMRALGISSIQGEFGK